MKQGEIANSRNCQSITQLGDNIWVVEGGNVSFHDFAYPTRSVIIRLENGGLWVWSPVELTSDIRKFVESTGAVVHLVSPNKLHYLFQSEWQQAFPDALSWGLPSTIRKRTGVRFDRTLGDRPPSDWSADIDQAWFRGSFALDEVAFFHRSSSTAIIADLVQTFSSEFLRKNWGRWSFLARLFGLTTAQAKAPIDLRLSFVRRSLARRARDKVLSWRCKRVVVAHGECILEHGNARLGQSFSWLGSSGDTPSEPHGAA